MKLWSSFWKRMATSTGAKEKKAKDENVEQYDHAITLEHAHKQKRST